MVTLNLRVLFQSFNFSLNLKNFIMKFSKKESLDKDITLSKA